MKAVLLRIDGLSIAAAERVVNAAVDALANTLKAVHESVFEITKFAILKRSD